MWAAKGLLRCVGFVFLLLACGCRVPAQIVWSPDGSAAAYRVEDKAYLIDSNGKVGAPLGTCLGGFAWSADSKTLYYANSSDLANPVTAPDTRWQIPARPQPTTAEAHGHDDHAAPASQPAKFVELQAFNDGKATSLAKFAAGDVMHMALSPDQNWLAIVTDTDSASTFAVYTYHLPSKRLYVLSDFAGFGMCFTGPNRLAYIQPDRLSDKSDSLTGKVVELTLNVDSASLDRTPLIDVVPAETPYIAALGENLLVTSVGRSFPGKPMLEKDKLVCKLFMWTRANGGIVSLADDVGPVFAVSPDGQRVLIEKLTAKTEKMPARRELHLIRANGSDGRMLRDLSKREIFAMWPAWRGNSEITFTGPEEEGKPIKVKDQQRMTYNVVQYKLTEKGELEPIKTLSEGWEPEMKPYLPIDPSPAHP